MRLSSKLTNGIILILIAVSALSGLYIYIFQRSSGLAIDLEGPEEVLSGAPFDLKVNFSNNSGAVLSDVRLTVILPEGFAFWGQGGEKNIDNKILGNAGAGSLIQESYKIIAFASAGESKKIKVAVNYAPASLGARFEKNNTKDILVRSSGIEVSLSVPEQAASGEEFPMEVAYRNIADEDFNDLELKLEYPPSFSFASASLRPDSGNNIWRLGDLRKNSEGKFTVNGVLIGSEGDEFEFKSELNRRVASNSYPVNLASAKTVIASSPLIFSIHLNSVNSDGAEYAARPGEILNYTISYLNNQEAALSDLAIRAQLAGEMFDLNSVQSDGFWRSVDNTLIWDSRNTSQLSLLAPGSAGVVNFQIRVKEAYPLKRFSDKNFVLKIAGEAAADSKILSKSLLETKVTGAVTIDAKAYFRDADSGFLNRGPMPPKAGQPTNFTIHWFLKSSAVDFSQVEVRGILGNNVKIVGSAKTPVGTVVYDENSREVVWRVDRLLANQGVIGAPPEAVFQVEAMPIAESAGNYLSLIGATNVTAVDDFTGKTVSSSDLPLTTALPDDFTVGQQGGVVQP